MVEKWSVSQVNGMAPDTASVTAGRKLAVASQWQDLGQAEHVLWGEIKGSGRNAYQACIEMTAPAFKCSCPSRKFPCKHALGLAYVYAESPDTFSHMEVPEWVNEWQQRREKRQQRAIEDAEQNNQSVDEDTQKRRETAQQKRIEKRQNNIQVGLEELQRWLNDTLRHGLVRSLEDAQAWQRMIKRLVDAQAQGLANWLQHCLDLRYSIEQWQAPLLLSLANLQLLLTANEQRAHLPDILQADMEDLLGLTRNKETLLAQPGITDSWWVMGKWSAQQAQIQVQRTWLWGATQQRWALLLDFAAPNQVLAIRPQEGQAIHGELVFYPGSWPVRALVKQQQSISSINPTALNQACHSIAELYQQFSEILAQYPWLDRMPAGLQQVTPALIDEQWLLIDEQQHQIPIASNFRWQWELLALSGGLPMDILGEWNGTYFFPLTVISDERVQGLYDLQRVVAE